MDKRTNVLLGTLVVLALCALGDADVSGFQVPVDPLYQGLPPQEPNSVRLGVQDPVDVSVQVSIKKLMMCGMKMKTPNHSKFNTKSETPMACSRWTRSAACPSLWLSTLRVWARWSTSDGCHGAVEQADAADEAQDGTRTAS